MIRKRALTGMSLRVYLIPPTHYVTQLELSGLTTTVWAFMFVPQIPAGAGAFQEYAVIP